MRIWIIAPGSRANRLRIVILLAVCAMLGPVPSIGSDNTLPDLVKGRQEAMKP